MKRANLLTALLLLGSMLLSAQKSAPPTLLLRFETNRHELTPEHQQQLQQLLTSLPGQPADYQVVVTGHTDARGSEEFNQTLSLRRGRSVSDFLATFGFSPDNTTLVADGERKPAADNASDDGMSLNRRVEVRFERAERRPSDLVPSMKVKFKAESGITLQNPRSGSKVSIPGGVLVRADGSPVTGEVEVQYREWRTFYELLSFGQSMHYHDAQGSGYAFNSNGMFEVNAFQNGEALGVAPGKSFTVEFNQMRADAPDVSLFQYNPQTGQWELPRRAEKLTTIPGQEPAFVPVGAPTPITEWAAANTNGRVSSRPNAPCYPASLRFPKEARPAQWLGEAAQSGLNFATGKDRLPVAFVENPALDDSTIIRLSERTQIDVERYDDNKAFFFFTDPQGRFTELEFYRKYQFEYVPSLKGDIFDEKTSQEKWTSLYLSYTDDVMNLYEITLANDTRKITFKARARAQDGRAVERVDNVEMYRQYKEVQAKRWTNALTDIGYIRRFAAFSAIFRPDNERCYDLRDWLKHFVTNKKMMAERYAKHVAADYANNSDVANQLIFEYNERCRRERLTAMEYTLNTPAATQAGVGMVLNLFGFGVYNCDQIFRLGPGTEVVQAKFRNRDGQIVVSRQTDVVEKTQQLLMTTTRPDQIYYSPNKTFDVLVRSLDGRTYLLRETEFAKIPLAGQRNVELVLDDVTEQIKSPKDWMKVLGI